MLHQQREYCFITYLICNSYFGMWVVPASRSDSRMYTFNCRIAMNMCISLNFWIVVRIKLLWWLVVVPVCHHPRSYRSLSSGAFLRTTTMLSCWYINVVIGPSSDPSNLLLRAVSLNLFDLRLRRSIRLSLPESSAVFKQRAWVYSTASRQP